MVPEYALPWQWFGAERSPQKSQAQNLAREPEQGNEIRARGDKEVQTKNMSNQAKDGNFNKAKICARAKECNKTNYERVKQRLRIGRIEQTIWVRGAAEGTGGATEARLRQQALGINSGSPGTVSRRGDAQARAAAEAEAQQAQAAREAKAVRDEGAKKLARWRTAPRHGKLAWK